MYMSAFNMVYYIVSIPLRFIMAIIMLYLYLSYQFYQFYVDLKPVLFSNIGNNCNKIIVHFLLKFFYLHTNVKFMNLF